MWLHAGEDNFTGLDWLEGSIPPSQLQTDDIAGHFDVSVCANLLPLALHQVSSPASSSLSMSIWLKLFCFIHPNSHSIFNNQLIRQNFMADYRCMKFVFRSEFFKLFMTGALIFKDCVGRWPTGRLTPIRYKELFCYLKIIYLCCQNSNKIYFFFNL